MILIVVITNNNLKHKMIVFFSSLFGQMFNIEILNSSGECLKIIIKIAYFYCFVFVQEQKINNNNNNYEIFYSFTGNTKN